MARPRMSAEFAERFKNPDSDPRGRWLAINLTMPGDRPNHLYELMGHFPPVGRYWRYSRGRMDEMIADGLIVQIRDRPPMMKRYLADSMVEEPAPEEAFGLPALVREFSRALARRLAMCPADLLEVEWRDLERVVAATCEGLGFETRLTRPAKDGGFDIELKADGHTYLVEVKHWSAPDRVGETEVKHFANVVVREAATAGLLLSTSGFRKNLLTQRIEVSPTRVRLGDDRKIVGLCQRYVETENGFLQPQTSLPEVLFLDTI